MPSYPNAWQSLSYVRADRLGRPADALPPADKAVELAPHVPSGWAGRAVIRGRVGDRAGAREDADRALQLSDDPQVLVWAACAYAVISPDNPADADRAAELLRQAVKAGFKDRTKLRADPDLVNLRHRPDLRPLLGAE
jgi:Flp pilus assembly protein TadD